MRRRSIIGALSIVAAVLAVTVRAGEVRYEVRPGESVSLIAKKFYDDVDQTESLLRYNGKKNSRIQVGEILRVPYCDVHYVKSGDTWSALAQRHLGRASTYPVIAALNGLPAGRGLQVNQKILIPVVLEHRLRRGESLASLAELFYEDHTRARLLQEFNDFKDPRRLAVGTPIRVPLLSFRLVESRSGPARFEAQISRARRTFEAGNFAASRTQLEAFRQDVEARGNKDERAELWRLQAFLHVAYDEPRRACSAFRSLGRLDPKWTRFDADLVSPKIREALAACS